MTASLPTLFQTGYLPGGATMAEYPKGAVAKMAGYPGARGTNSTHGGNWVSTNPNQPIADIQRVGMAFTSELLAKGGSVPAAYNRTRSNYCAAQCWKPNTGDPGLNRAVIEWNEAQWEEMGVGGCSMLDAFDRTAHWELPIRGDSGLIWNRDYNDKLRLMEFSADMLGEPFYFVNPKVCSLKRLEGGDYIEVAGRDLVYYAGRYFKGCDCVAYKIYERTASGWWSNPVIYGAEDVIYFVDPFNFRSLRGVTIYAQALQDMQRGADILAAALASCQKQALYSGVISNNSGTPNGAAQYPGENGEDWEGPTGTYWEKLPHGPIDYYNFNGDKFDFPAANAPGEQAIEGVKASDQRVALSLGLTYAFLFSYNDLGGAPSRLDVNRCTKEILRIVNRICRPRLNRITRQTIMDGVNKGIFGYPDESIYKGEWMFTTLPTADAFRDAISDLKSARGGQDSSTRVLSALGLTFEDIMEDKENEVVAAYSTLSKVNSRLAQMGIEERAQIADIVAISENPLQQEQSEDLTAGKPTTITDTKALPEK